MFPVVVKRQQKAEGVGLKALQNILQEGVDQHAFTISNVEATAQLVMLLIKGLTERILIEENRTTWKVDMHLFLDLILKGLEVRN
jgi:hypothetical protein